ncbi:S41 family peptidase [Salirhabdus sp. Marseille-P4669]|uniref:S41 family peptidase n=1 Tax=Salirhabdus sp. Marseille-P4669 TaxID=2042310 RepID=UPI000C7C1EA0|nr:S41 family peptidase [Salirhabdus sp. Marseille-P4669]
MNIKNRYLVVIVLIAVLFGGALTYTALEVIGNNEEKVAQDASSTKTAEEKSKEVQNAVVEPDANSDQFSKFMNAYAIIKDNYIEQVEDEELVEGAIQGMLEVLDDPHTVYMDLETVEQFNDSIESSFEGIGAEVNMEDGVVTIVAPIKGSPAEDAGLMPKDQILQVDGESLEGYDLYEAVSKIRGEKGSTVTLQIRRPGVDQLLEVDVVRDEIPIETVYKSVREVDGKKTGVIEITSFSTDTARDFNKALEELEAEGIDGLVIDVRGNPGGLFESVEVILENFIPKDQPYVLFEHRNGEKQRFYSGTNDKKDYPISVLMNNGSASASEILAAAMKEAGYDIVGEQSYGKGTVQKTLQLGDGSNIKITVYKWLTPSGEWINEKGVAPTIEAKQPEFFYTTPFQVEEPYTFDMSNDAIANIQKMLKGIGYDPGREDGYFSKEMEEVVKKFQTDHGLTASGQIDKDTGAKIQEVVMDAVRDEENDKQMNTALKELYQ